MPRERDPPYVAAGFQQDVERLMQEFVRKKTVKFKEFAEVWRKYSFSTIFMGRENLKELIEFIEECYRSTLAFMDSTNPLQKLGAVYLLYSLYLKQPSLLLKAPVSIVVSIKQGHDLCELEDYFANSGLGEDVQDVIFVINKLFKMEAVRISAFPIPMGPAVPISVLKLEPVRRSDFKETLGTLSMVNERDVKHISELSKKYEELKKQLPCLCAASETTAGLNRFSELKETICELEDRYNAGFLPNKVCGDAKIEDEFRDLGRRRSKLKAQQFERIADVGMFRRMRDSSDSSSPSHSPEPSSPPPIKRGPGRPRKKKEAKRGRKKRVGNVKVKTEFDAEEDDDVQSEIVDNPVGPVVQLATRRPSRFPRPIRKHYFEDD